MNPIEVTVPNLSMFFKIRQNAFHAEAQKFFPVIAIWIYAFLVMNLMNLSKQSRRYLVAHNKALITALSLLAF